MTLLAYQGLTDNPSETGLDGTDRFVQIVPVQAHSRFKSKRVTGTKSDKRYPGRAGQLRGDLYS